MRLGFLVGVLCPVWGHMPGSGIDPELSTARVQGAKGLMVPLAQLMPLEGSLETGWPAHWVQRTRLANATWAESWLLALMVAWCVVSPLPRPLNLLHTSAPTQPVGPAPHQPGDSTVSGLSGPFREVENDDSFSGEK